MKHFWALLIKFAVIGTVLFSFLSIFNTASLPVILFISVITTAISYFVGDLYILPKFGNFIATIADFGLSFVLIWLLSALMINSTGNMLTTTFIIALTIAAVEALFHLYVNTHVNSNSAESVIPGVYKGDLMMTEFSEEFDSEQAKKNANQDQPKKN
ncbi:YndM family protein [Mesobacillus maritimus]|uniref:YndM family protein n=1 Tax=Mesobacillus maritimus TaxID=1643336 RepID=A0ABS7K4G0_9BACI|nr:YndM family protein [Mesobacillus maritimus]MBY0097153.1 YndM family protein [Mesobacillus maritimus]